MLTLWGTTGTDARADEQDKKHNILAILCLAEA